MKKNLLIILVLFLVIMSGLFMKYISLKRINQEIQKFNYGYEFYNRDNLRGLDITTVINKAIDNNERYNVPKDEEGYYIENENSIEIEIKMIINNKTYPMERIKQIGMDSFSEFFGDIHFKCTNVEYNKNTKKISKMFFESIEY